MLELKIGDADGNGTVDAERLAAYWMKRRGAVWSEGDFNSDGKVNDADAALLAANWAASPSFAAPEPNLLVLFSGVLLVTVSNLKKNVRVVLVHVRNTFREKLTDLP